MFASRRRRLPVASDSSDDDPPQRRRQLRASTRAQSFNIWTVSGSSKHQVKRQDTSNNNSGRLVSPRKKQKLPISTSEESSSSEDEEILQSARRGSMRVLSDYETGDSPSETGSPQEGSLQSKEESDFSSDSDVVRTRSATNRKRQFAIFSSTDSSDSGIPIGFRRKRKRFNLATSSEGSDSEDSSDSELVIDGTRSDRSAAGSSGPSTSTHVPMRQRVPGPVRPRYNTRGSRSNTQPVLNTTRPRANRHPIVRSPSLESNDTDSSSDSVDSLRHPLNLDSLLQESEDSSSSSSSSSITEPEVVTIKAVSTHKILSPKKRKLCISSSDSDGESEKCPICLARFGSQDIGVPGSCDHHFCSVCIREWAKNNNTCPVDRKSFNLIKVLSAGGGKVISEIQIDTPPERAMGDEWWEAFNIINTIYEEFGGSDDNSDGPDEVCCVCFNNSRNDNMIVCDYCDNVFHMNCINPPLRSLPATDWYCPDCHLVMSSSDSD